VVTGTVDFKSLLWYKLRKKDFLKNLKNLKILKFLGKKIMDYQLKISQKQAQTIQTACEMLARLNMGQVNIVFSDCFIRLPVEKLEDLREKAKEIELLLKLSNIFQNLPEESKIAWDLNQVIRHKVSHDIADEEKIPMVKRWTVNYDDPLKSCSEPLAKIEKTT
jgi:hypothetical protein